MRRLQGRNIGRIPDTRAGAPECEEGIKVRQVESHSHSFVLVEDGLDVIDRLILSNSGASGRNRCHWMR